MENEVLNPALSDIAEIMDRPTLNDEEWKIVAIATPWLKSMLKPEVRTELNVQYKTEMEAYVEEQKKLNAEQVKEYMDNWKKSQEPLSNDELGLLLNQEYLEFKLKIKVQGEDTLREFTICELNQLAEIRFVKVLQDKLIPVVQEIAAADWHIEDKIIDKIKGWLTKIPENLAVAAELVAIILDPKGKDASINKDWVQENLSTYRITAIISTQVEANRYRDFFSNGSRLYRSLTGK